MVRTCYRNRSLRAGSLVWVGYCGQRSWREEWVRKSELTFPRLILLAGFTGSRFFVAFDRDTLSKQVRLLAGYRTRDMLRPDRLLGPNADLTFTKETESGSDQGG